MMLKPILALTGAAVALTGAASAAEARPHANTVCTQWRHGTCVRSRTVVRNARAMPNARYRVGYRFGPNYSYSSYSAIPQTYVSRYHLRPNYRYVTSGNTVYVVDPTTYAVTQVLNGIVR